MLFSLYAQTLIQLKSRSRKTRFTYRLLRPLPGTCLLSSVIESSRFNPIGTGQWSAVPSLSSSISLSQILILRNTTLAGSSNILPISTASSAETLGKFHPFFILFYFIFSIPTSIYIDHSITFFNSNMRKGKKILPSNYD